MLPTLNGHKGELLALVLLYALLSGCAGGPARKIHSPIPPFNVSEVPRTATAETADDIYNCYAVSLNDARNNIVVNGREYPVSNLGPYADASGFSRMVPYSRWDKTWLAVGALSALALACDGGAEVNRFMFSPTGMSLKFYQDGGPYDEQKQKGTDYSRATNLLLGGSAIFSFVWSVPWSLDGQVSEFNRYLRRKIAGARDPVIRGKENSILRNAARIERNKEMIQRKKKEIEQLKKSLNEPEP
jgi:hypothetical protein